MEPSGEDLSALFAAWKYDGDERVRRVRTSSGREVIQVRLPLGIEQYELDGRPDGMRPHDQESWFHYYSEKSAAVPWDFILESEDMERLRQECLLYYYRYLLFFQIRDYKSCARDTFRNLRVLDFVSKHSAREEAETLEQYRPYILRMHLMARALEKVQEESDVKSAVGLLDEGKRALEGLPAMAGNDTFERERRKSLRLLRNLRDELQELAPPDPLLRLRRRLERAIEAEDYEQAARLRDELSARLENAGE